MKITSLLLFLFVFCVHAENLHSQTTLLSVKHKNARLEEIIEEIEKQSNWLFVYTKDVDIKERYSIDAKKASIEETLKELFSGSDISYEIESSYIVLSKDKQESIQKATQQDEKQIKGIITDPNGEPVIGANVIEKGVTMNGTITDINGEFSLTVAPHSVLRITYIGYLEQEINVGSNSILKIIMQEDTQSLDEVIVIGYGTQKKVNLTGAVAAINGDVLENRPISNLGQGLQGLVPNLNITTTSGLAGQGSSYNIRGTTSINGGEPLILVDGVQMDPNLINPQDIASLSVLKDAASAAIYGARGAYGVILITTKTGQTDRPPVISFNTNLGLHQPVKIAKSASGLEFANYFNLVQKNSGMAPKYSEQYMQHIIAYDRDPKNNLPVFYDPVNFDNFDYMYCGNTNWYEEVFNKVALNQQYNISLTGGDQKTSYYTSIGMNHDKGLMKGYPDTYKRYNVNINLTSAVSKWLSLSAKVVYNHSVQNIPGGNEYPWGGGTDYSGDLGINSMFPLMPVYHPDGNYAGQGTWTNPVGNAAQGGYKKTKYNDMWLTGGIRINPVAGFNIIGDYSFNFYNLDQIRHRKEYYEYKAVEGAEKVFPWTSPSSVRNYSDNDYYHVVNLYAEYEKKFGKHYTKVMAGYNQENKYIRGFGGERLELINNKIAYPDLAKGEIFMRNSKSTSWAVNGGFFRINYIFDDKYLLEINSRLDASSKFPKGNRTGFFPSVSGGWRISNEAFMENTRSILDDLKFKISYGSLGNQALKSNFPYLPALSSDANYGYIIGNSLPVAISAAGLVSDSFTWETVTQVNAGADFSLFHNRLTGAFDWYTRKTSDMLAPHLPFPATLGTEAPSENSASLKTNGWELSLNWRNKTSYGFSYNLGIILSDYKSTILKYTNPNGVIDTYYKGKRIDEIWGYTTEGLFQSEEEITAHADQSALYGGQWYPGDVKFKDLDGDGKIGQGLKTLDDHGDLSIIGNSTPRYSFGITLGGEWKGFDLDLFFQGIGKKDFAPQGAIFWGMTSEWDAPTAFVIDNYWTEDNPNGFLPRQSFWNGNRQTQTRYLYNAAYIRLKQLTIGYTIPQQVTKKVLLDKVRVYFTGHNLFTIDGLPQFYDPEALNPAAYPHQRIFSFGLNIVL